MKQTYKIMQKGRKRIGFKGSTMMRKTFLLLVCFVLVGLAPVVAYGQAGTPPGAVADFNRFTSTEAAELGDPVKWIAIVEQISGWVFTFVVVFVIVFILLAAF